MKKIDWPVLQATWLGLTTIMDSYETGSTGWEKLVEARRLVEVEMHIDGYAQQFTELISREEK